MLKRFIAISPESLSTLDQWKQWRLYAQQQGAEHYLIRTLPKDKKVLDWLQQHFQKEPQRYILHARLIPYFKHMPAILHFNSQTVLSARDFPTAIKGFSAHSIATLFWAKVHGFHYAFLSPIFPTASHPRIPALGITYLKKAVEQSPLPIWALGGIVTKYHVEKCLQCGVKGIASIRRFCRLHL